MSDNNLQVKLIWLENLRSTLNGRKVALNVLNEIISLAQQNAVTLELLNAIQWTKHFSQNYRGVSGIIVGQDKNCILIKWRFSLIFWWKFDFSTIKHPLNDTIHRKSWKSDILILFRLICHTFLRPKTVHFASSNHTFSERIKQQHKFACQTTQHLKEHQMFIFCKHFAKIYAPN